ncbi:MULTISPECIES: porin family protein [unclassified Lentimicrobium]|uniref:porin family protein n=1 Tax=unclassified Lentimicrobium TaxID=2677434 RepID=UPI0015523458|nr:MULTISPECIES: porin family protein [unclassified Lentimicrobium]NPD45402.1 PorT family protein [Lentimicrobium sp. S6]NPD84899.1 PorT family protein [Lentimicrobium sp. L6]
MNNLKKQALVITLSLIVSLGAFAQKAHYGVKAGANFAVQSEIADYANNNNIRTGLTVGVFGNYTLNDKVSFQAELNYDQKGGKTDDATLKYDYLSVPVLFKYSLGKSDKTALKFNVNLGPYAAFLLQSEVEISDQTIDMKDQTEDFELGGILGFGMKYPVGKQNLVLDLRMGLGFTQFDKVDSTPNNKYIGLTLGYEF